MDINAIMGAIGSVGFPIVMCLILIKRMQEQDDKHELEMTKITDALNQNTQALKELTVYIGKVDSKNENS